MGGAKRPLVADEIELAGESLYVVDGEISQRLGTDGLRLNVRDGRAWLLDLDWGSGETTWEFARPMVLRDDGTIVWATKPRGREYVFVPAAGEIDRVGRSLFRPLSAAEVEALWARWR